MKLDKIKFANVISFLASHGTHLLEAQLYDLDDLIDIEVPVTNCYPDVRDIGDLMFLMADGTKKIEAIKLYRKLTGMPLKESKDAVERYWPDKQFVEHIKDALGTAENGEDLLIVARNAHRAELELASQHNSTMPGAAATLGDILGSMSYKSNR